MLKALYTSSNKNKVTSLFKNNYPIIRECNEDNNLHILYRNICPPDYMLDTTPAAVIAHIILSVLLYLINGKGMYEMSKLHPLLSLQAQVSILTKRAPYKMYEIRASSNRCPHFSRPLTSSVTEPPLHSCGWESCEGEKKEGKTSPQLIYLLRL